MSRDVVLGAHTISFVQGAGGSRGFIWRHPHASGAGNECEGDGWFAPKGPWVLEREEAPELTIRPSLRCLLCGAHVNVTDGVVFPC